MATEKKADKERELDSFLRSAEETKRRPHHYDEWDTLRERGSKRGNLIGIVVVVALALVALVLLYAFKEMKVLKSGAPGIDKIIDRTAGNSQGDSLKVDQGKYQAVFLTNGQVYFGKVVSHNESYVELVDIYYLQVKPVLQQGDGNNNDNKSSQEQKTELSLVKLGNELHGPLDRMMMNKDQVVFVEDLKDDSKVTDAIKRYQQQGQR